MVTGAPGSGKTTLGRAIADALRLPFLSRDDVRGGQYATAGLWTNQIENPVSREAAVDAFVQIIETAAELGVSAVAEFVVLPHRVEAFARMQAAADCLVVLCECAESPARLEQRVRADPLLNRPDVLAALGRRSIDDYLHDPERDLVATTMQTEFAVPTLHVRTNDGYDPRLETVIEWVVDQTRHRRR
jgi:predicted kinase